MRTLLLLALLLLPSSLIAAPTAGMRDYQTVRAAAVLTNAYVATTPLNMKINNQLACLVSFTLGSLTSAEIKVQYSDDNSTYFDETILNTAAGGTTADEFISPLRVNVYQLSATSAKLIAVPVMARYVRLAIKGTGAVGGSSATIQCYAGVI